MTDSELYCYSMDSSELEIWESFCDTVKAKCEAMNLPEIGSEIVNRRLVIREPYHAARGYSKQAGYYEICEGDRGSLTAVIRTHSHEEAVYKMLSELAHDISYQFVFKNKEKIEEANRADWHFYEVKDGIENGRYISHLEENQTWKYDAEYDYRKYWFELAISYLKNVVAVEDLEKEIAKYEEFLNFRFKRRFWVFDMNEMRFK